MWTFAAFALSPVLATLAFLGRHGTVAIAASLLVGIALPGLAAQARPFLAEAILALLTLAFLKIGFRALGDELKHPAIILFSAGIAMIALPAMVFMALGALGVAENHPGVFLAMFIALAVPPITAVPVFSSLLGLPGPVALAFLLICMAATPLIATTHAQLFLSQMPIDIDSIALGLRLFAFLAGAAFLAFAIQRLVGQKRLDQARTHLNGVNVLAMFVFAVAIMDGFTAALLDNPALIVTLLLATFALALAQMGLMRLVLFFLEPAKATSIALATGLRNMGLLVASIGTDLPAITWLWFVVGQFPIFFMPWIIELFRRSALVKRERGV